MDHCKFLYCLASFLTNYSLVIDFVAYRHKTSPLDNILLFPTRKFPIEDVEPTLQQRLQIPQVIVKNEISHELGNIVNRNSMALIFVVRIVEQGTLWQVASTLNHHPFIPIVCVSMRVPSIEDQKDFFEFFSRINMINLLLMYRVNGTMMVRTYSSFPELRIIKLDASDVSSFLWCRYANVHGYNFKVSVFYDPPMVYLQGNRTKLQGVIGQMLRLFIRSLNGTISVVPFPMSAKKRRTIDIHANLLLRAGKVQSRAEPSYPLFRTQVCIVLPVESEIPRQCYLHEAFDVVTWFFLGLTFLCLLLLICWITYQYKCRDSGAYALIVIKLFLNQPIDDKLTTNLNILVAYFGALFIVFETLYSGSLTSMFSAKVLMPKVRTAEDFLATDLRIMIFPQDRELYFDSALLPPALIPRLYPVNHSTLSAHLLAANTSFAYLMTHEKWLWYKKTQKYLQRPFFRISDDDESDFCTKPLHQIMDVQHQSPFKRSLTMYIMILQQHGFIIQWLAEAKPSLSFRMSNRTKLSNDPMTLEHLTFGLYMLAFGWTLASLVFVGELVVWRRREILMRLRSLRLWKIFVRKCCRKKSRK